jgi:hypothetical protein
MRMDGYRHAPAALPSGKSRGTHCIGGWVSPRPGLHECGKCRLHRDSIPEPLARSEYPAGIPCNQIKSNVFVESR